MITEPSCLVLEVSYKCQGQKCSQVCPFLIGDITVIKNNSVQSRASMLQRVVSRVRSAQRAGVRSIANVAVTRDDGLPDLIITPLAAKVGDCAYGALRHAFSLYLTVTTSLYRL